MKQDQKNISFVIPAYNEAALIADNTKRLFDYCQKNHIKAEVLICENGSTDDSKKIIKSLNYPGLRKIFVKEKGLGRAYKAGINASTQPVIYFTGIDFPFGLSNILDCYKHIPEYDFVFASKAHPKSIVKSGFKRKVSSGIYRLLLRVILGLTIHDPQGCTMFKRDKIVRHVNTCDSPDAFFTTQLALYGEKSGLRMLEIPVDYSHPRAGSKMSITHDGWRMFKQIWAERERAKNFK